MKSSLKLEIARELANDLVGHHPDRGLHAGVDSLHPLYRSTVATSFATWNLLNLWGHNEIRARAVHALDEYGDVSCASRSLGGVTSLLTADEARVAQFFAGESALLFESRNQAILTLITALATGGGVVIGPAMSNLPLADACALVDLEFLECESIQEYNQALERNLTAPRVIVVAETVSATTGKSLDIPAFFTSVSQCNPWVVLDESSAIGYSGLRGAGSAETLPTSPHLLARIANGSILTGTSATALVCPKQVRELLMQRSRYLRMESPPRAIETATLHAAIDLAEVAITTRKKLTTRARLVQTAIREQGWRTASDESSPIVTLWFDTFQEAYAIQDALMQRNIIVEALTARSIRRNGAVVRINLSSGHSDLEVSQLLDSLLEIRKRILGQPQDG